jgi:hypothetical protein
MNSVGTMEQMFKKYKGVAEFRMIYIREAHAADGQRPGRLGQQLEINEHQNYQDRCDVAERLIKDRKLTMPMLIDDFTNSTDSAYQAKPDRVFLVRTDGRLAVAADRGPRGFAPALEECSAWLEQYSIKKEEPKLSKTTLDAANLRSAKRDSGTTKKGNQKAGGKSKAKSLLNL